VLLKKIEFLCQFSKLASKWQFSRLYFFGVLKRKLFVTQKNTKNALKNFKKNVSLRSLNAEKNDPLFFVFRDKKVEFDQLFVAHALRSANEMHFSQTTDQ